MDEYSVSGYEQLYGFIVGLLAGNYDITHIFVDSTLKIAGKDFVAFEAMLSRLTALPVMEHVQELIFTVSCDADELPDALKKYIV